jgi:hypothetical protein
MRRGLSLIEGSVAAFRRQSPRCLLRGLQTCAPRHAAARAGASSVDAASAEAAASRRDPSPVLSNKSKVCLTLSDRIGSLQQVLGLFSTHHVNISHIDSRPSKGPMCVPSPTRGPHDCEGGGNA